MQPCCFRRQHTNTIKISYMRIFTILAFVLLFQETVIAQHPLDVLPLSGRNELFHTFLMDRGGELWDARRDSVAASLESVDALLARQAQLREDYISLLGDLPENMPLNAEVIGTVQGDGYIIERLHYQSSPGHHVTANFYIPDTGEGPYPAVLVMCGHYPVAKIISIHQKLGALFATNGIAALTVDPFSQGERYQLMDPVTGELNFLGESGTGAHTRLDVGAVLAGSSVVARALWDNHRGVDYLYSRTDVVDTTRVGCTGSSGGGSQATNLLAFDERIKVAAVNSFLMNEETLYSTIGPQTASQNLSYEGAHLIDHPDYITMFAPKPMMILAATQDFFDVTATQATHAEAVDVYTLLGEADKIAYFEEDAAHGYLKPRREEAVRWFRKWFLGDDSPVSEPFTLRVMGVDVLQVTGTGQVVTEFTDEKTVTDLNVEMADAYGDHRTAFWTENTQDSCLNKVRELIRMEAYETAQVDEVEVIQRDGYTLTKLQINSGDHVPVTGLLLVPDGLTEAVPAVVYVDGRGKRTDAGEGGVLEQQFIDSTKIVLSIDVRGFGETADNPSLNETKHGNKEHRNAVIAAYIGKTLIGQRVEDIMKAIDALLTYSEVDANDLTLVGIDRAGSAVAHAVALDDRVDKAIIRASFESWLPMVGNPTELDNMTHMVPFALKYYDLPDLVNTLAPDAVTYFAEPYEIVVSTNDLSAGTQGSLGQNFPNPSASATTIPYQLKQAGSVGIRIYDQLGHQVLHVDQGWQAEGAHQVSIDLERLPVGQYYYQLWLDERAVGSRQMILSK